MYNNNDYEYDDDYDYDYDDDKTTNSNSDIFSHSGRNVSSRSYTDISSRSSRYADTDEPDAGKYRPAPQRTPVNQNRTKNGGSKPAAKRKKRKKHIFLKTVAVLLCVVIVAFAAFYGYAYNLLNKIKRTELDASDLGIATTDYKGYKNIALLGIDTRQDNKTGRSDAIVILTVDKAHRKIKLTSIARDSYVSIDGHSKDKLTHAYAYGRSQLAVKTLNQNFGLEITDYVTMNFFELARVINYIGGVEIDVTEKEFKELNRIIGMTKFEGMENKKISAPGLQVLTGTQAVCYARIRKIDGDVERGNRQKTVLSAMFKAAKKLNPTKLPQLASLITEQCETSLSSSDILNLGMWAILFSPEFESLSIPNDNVKGKGQTISGVWYYTYDIDKAKKEISDFIFEKNYYSPEEVAKRKAEDEK